MHTTKYNVRSTGTEIVSELLKHLPPEVIEEPGPHGFTPLFFARSFGNKAIIELLLDNNATDVQIITTFPAFPFITADHQSAKQTIQSVFEMYHDMVSLKDKIGLINYQLPFHEDFTQRT